MAFNLLRLLFKICLRVLRIIIKGTLLLMVAVVNLIFITLFCTILEQIALGLFSGTIKSLYEQYTFLPNVIKSMPLIIVGVFFSYLISPLHYKKLKKENRFEPLRDDDQQRINSLISELKLKRTPQIYRIKDTSLNAMAFGFNTIGLNQGTIDLATDQELKGVICHELGHLAHYDYLYNTIFHTFQRPGIYCLRMILKGFSLFTQAIAFVLGIFFTFGQDLVIVLHNLYVFSSMLFINIFFGGVRTINANLNKYAEYRCDTYANRHNCAAGLADFLERSVSSIPVKESLFTRLQNEHPRTTKRIKRLYKMQEQSNKAALENMRLEIIRELTRTDKV